MTTSDSQPPHASTLDSESSQLTHAEIASLREESRQAERQGEEYLAKSPKAKKRRAKFRK